MSGKQQSGGKKEIRSHSTAGRGLVLTVSAPFDPQYSHLRLKTTKLCSRELSKREEVENALDLFSYSYKGVYRDQVGQVSLSRPIQLHQYFSMRREIYREKNC